MTFAEARAAIEVYLNTNWTQTPIAWQNVEEIDFSAPGQPLLRDGTDAFIAVEIFIHTSQTITVPGSCVRYPGTLEFGVFVKEGTGARTAAELTDDLIALFENKNIGTAPNVIRLRNMTSTETYTEEDGWFVSLVGFAMYFERFISQP